MDNRAIMRDCEHLLLDGSSAISLVDGGVLGEHDDPGEDPHCHYSILTVEDGLVVNVDWGYHTEREAVEVVLSSQHSPY